LNRPGLRKNKKKLACQRDVDLPAAQEHDPKENNQLTKERKQFMKTCNPLLRVLTVVLTFACIATAADAPKLTFKFTTIDVIDAQQTWIMEVNNKSEMVGYYIDQSGVSHGFLREGKNTKTIDDPKGTSYTLCFGLNSKGTIVGEYADSANKVHGFKYLLRPA
jgi:hypothetical protein